MKGYCACACMLASVHTRVIACVCVLYKNSMVINYHHLLFCSMSTFSLMKYYCSPGLCSSDSSGSASQSIPFYLCWYCNWSHSSLESFLRTNYDNNCVLSQHKSFIFLVSDNFILLHIQRKDCSDWSSPLKAVNDYSLGNSLLTSYSV